MSIILGEYFIKVIFSIVKEDRVIFVEIKFILEFLYILERGYEDVKKFLNYY